MIIRNDDFDPRYDLAIVKQVHEEFLKRGLTETICVQAIRNGALRHRQDVVAYVRSQEGYDVALHGWNHEQYHVMEDVGEIVKHLAASLYLITEQFDIHPTVFYPPWNGDSPQVRAACQFLGLTFSNSAAYITHYIKEPQAYNDVEAIYFHMWEPHNIEALPTLLDILKEHGSNTL